MTYYITYRIARIKGQYRIPIQQDDDVNAITQLIKNDFSINNDLSSKIFGSHLHYNSILSQSVRSEDVVTFSPRDPQSQLTMSRQIIIMPRDQSRTTFTVFSTISFNSMIIGDKIQINIELDTKKDILNKIKNMFYQKYMDEINQNNREIRKMLLFLPGGIPFFDGTLIKQFYQSFPDFKPHLYVIVIYNNNITNSILNQVFENVCNINDELLRTLITPYFDNELKGLCEFASFLGYIQHNGPNVKQLIYSIAKFCPFAPLICGLFGLMNNFTGLTLIQITAPLSILFYEMSKNIPNHTNLFSLTTKFITYFMNIEISDRVPCTTFTRPFYNIGHEMFFHSTMEKNTQIEKIFAFNPDFEPQHWIRFKLPSLTEEDFKSASRNTKYLSIKSIFSLSNLETVSLFQGQNGPCLFLSKSDHNIKYINPEIGNVETENFENLAIRRALINQLFESPIIDPIDLKKVTQLVFFCVCKSSSMNSHFDQRMSRFVASMKFVSLFIRNCYVDHVSSLYGSILFGTQVEISNELNPFPSNFQDLLVAQTETGADSSRSVFQAINVAAENLVRSNRNDKYERAVLRIIVLCDGKDTFNYSPSQITSIASFLVQNKIKVDTFFISNVIQKEIVALSRSTGGICVYLNNYNDAVDLFNKEEFYNVELRSFGNSQNIILNELIQFPQISANNLYDEIVVKENEFINQEQIVIIPSSEYINLIINDSDLPTNMTRILKELNLIITNFSEEIKVFPLKDKLDIWRVLIKGIDHSLYSNKWFCLIIEFDDDYPQHSPLLRFAYPPFHPNITDRSRVRLEFLDQLYRSSDTIGQIITEIRNAMLHPNFERPVDKNRECMHLYDQIYIQKVDEWNKRNGKNSVDDWTSGWRIEQPPLGHNDDVYYEPIYMT